MAELKTTFATTGDANVVAYKEKTATKMAEIFLTDPVMTFLLSALSAEQRARLFNDYFQTLMKAAMLNGGVFQEANDWSCMAIWMLPGKKVDNPLTLIPAGLITAIFHLGLKAVKKMLWDHVWTMDTIKKRCLGKEKFHYLFFIATVVEARGQGLASKVIEARKEVARRDGRPIYLEATTEKSMRLYERLGFETLELVVLGKGTHNEDGLEEKGGKGVPTWPMIWRPEKGGDGTAVKAEVVKDGA